jgi:prephenate dehydrogenase
MKIAVCRVRIEAANYDRVRAFLHGLGLEIIETTPREHDRRLARTQAIFHLISQALKELDWRGQRLSTPGPAAFYRLAETVQNDTAELFLDMERRNVYASAYRRQFISKLVEIDELLSRGETSEPA